VSIDEMSVDERSYCRFVNGRSFALPTQVTAFQFGLGYLESKRGAWSCAGNYFRLHQLAGNFFENSGNFFVILATVVTIANN
jgi:hypothetical protein